VPLIAEGVLKGLRTLPSHHDLSAFVVQETLPVITNDLESTLNCVTL